MEHSGTSYHIEPELRGTIRVGSSLVKDGETIFLGRLAEGGHATRVDADITEEFVWAILGQRGSGKSFTLGSILESFVTKAQNSTIGSRRSDRAVLLLDPLSNFWTTENAITDGPQERLKRQYASLAGWPVKVEDINCTIWLPAGLRRDFDPPFIKEFVFRTADLQLPDLADMLGLNAMSDPQGILLSEVVDKTREVGYTTAEGPVAANQGAGIDELLDCLEHDIDFQNPIAIQNAGYAPATVRTLKRNLDRFRREPMFSGTGTALTDLLKPGHLSVLMLPHRMGKDLRSVIARVLMRRILADREIAATQQNELDLMHQDTAEAAKIAERLKLHIPRTVVAIDEAQDLLGDKGGAEKEAIEDFCLVGRNYGLSMILATQRPETSAISAKVRDLVSLFFLHNLGSQKNIDTARGNLLAPEPTKVEFGDQEFSFFDLLRHLKTGYAILSAKSMKADGRVQRSFVLNVRPRIRVHGGSAS
jgi:hypothetical protein